jgi:hypothetical protein
MIYDKECLGEFHRFGYLLSQSFNCHVSLVRVVSSVGSASSRRLTEVTVTREVLSSENQREKEDRLGESQPFRERTSSVQDKVHPGLKSNPQPNAYNTSKLSSILTRLF